MANNDPYLVTVFFESKSLRSCKLSFSFHWSLIRNLYWKLGWQVQVKCKWPGHWIEKSGLEPCMFWKMCSRHLRLSVDPYCRSTFINLSIDILINVLVDPWSTPDQHSFDTSIDKIDSASILDGVSVKISWHLSNCQLRCWSSVGWVSIEMLIKGWKRLRISSWLRVP